MPSHGKEECFEPSCGHRLAEKRHSKVRWRRDRFTSGGSDPSLQSKVPSRHSPPAPGTHVPEQQSPPSKPQTLIIRGETRKENSASTLDSQRTGMMAHSKPIPHPTTITKDYPTCSHLTSFAPAPDPSEMATKVLFIPTTYQKTPHNVVPPPPPNQQQYGHFTYPSRGASTVSRAILLTSLFSSKSQNPSPISSDTQSSAVVVRTAASSAKETGVHVLAQQSPVCYHLAYVYPTNSARAGC